jgi:PAS domain-containing protein/HPt (histidine-containing phosphotransfer) domain-containing protein
MDVVEVGRNGQSRASRPAAVANSRRWFSLRGLSVAQATTGLVVGALAVLAILAALAHWRAGAAIAEVERASYDRLVRGARDRLDRLAARDRRRVAEVAFSDELYATLERLALKPDSGFRPGFAAWFPRAFEDRFVGVYDLQGTPLFRWNAPGADGLEAAAVSNALFHVLDNREPTAGMVRNAEELVWVAGAPILPSGFTDPSRPIRGYVIAARPFAGEALEVAVAGGRAIPQLARVASPAPTPETTADATAGGDSVVVRYALSDVFAEPNTRADLALSRTEFRAAEARLRTILVAGLVALTGLAGAGWWLAQRWVAGPVKRLAKALAPVHEGQTPALLGPLAPQAEWVAAVAAVNRLLAHARTAQDRFDRAFDAVRDGIWEYDFVSGQWTFSSRFRSHLGHDGTGFPNVRESLVDALHPEDRDQTLVQLQLCSGTGRPFARELRLRRKDGGYAWFRLEAHVELDHAGAPQRFVGRLIDIEPERDAQARIDAAERSRLEAERAHGRFLVATAARAGGSAAWASDLARIGSALAGELLVRRLPFDLHQTLREAVESNPKAEVIVAPGVATRVQGDPDLLRLAVSHLAANAARVSSDAWTAIRAERGDGADMIRIAVEDRGPPLAGAERERIAALLATGLDPDESAAWPGLGLRVVHGVARALGGHAGIEPRPEGGSRVWLSAALPAEVVVAPPADNGHEPHGETWEVEDLWDPATTVDSPAASPAPTTPVAEPRVELVADATVTIDLDRTDPPERSPIDPATLDQLRASLAADGLGLGTQLMSLFLAEAPLQLDALERADRAGDRAAAGRAAAELKGMCALVGAGAMVEVCESVGAGDVGMKGLAALRAEFERVRRVLEGVLGSRDHLTFTGSV